MTTPIWDWPAKYAAVLSALVKLTFIVGFIIGIGAGVVFLGGQVQVDSGEYGIVTTPDGEVIRVLEPGHHFISPMNDVYSVPKQVTISEDVKALSKDGVQVKITYVGQTNISRDQAPAYYHSREDSRYRLAKLQTNPCARDALRDVAAQYNASTLITKEGRDALATTGGCQMDGVKFHLANIHIENTGTTTLDTSTTASGGFIPLPPIV